MSQNLTVEAAVTAEQVYAAYVAGGERKYGPAGGHIPISASEREQTFLHRWERMVELYGPNPAIEEAGRTLTYVELNRLANLIAHTILARQDAMPMASDAPVALLFDVEADLPVGILAAWKAGKFLTWLEARQPLIRNQLIVEESGAAIVVTNRKNEAIARQLWPRPENVIVIEEVANGFSEELASSNPPITIDGFSPAYLIYTSGSTGKPKGTLELHRNLIYFMAARQLLFHFGPQDRAALLLYGVGCMFCMFSALLYGGCVLPYQVKNEGLSRFSKWLNDYRITLMVGGADLRTWLLSLDGSQQFPDLRFVALSTGPSYREHVEAYQRYLPDSCRLFILYSATEFRCGGLFIFDKETHVEGRIVPAGYTTSPSLFEIWDEAGNPLPTGASGEIVICSPYVAAGYWKSPESSASKFGTDGSGRRYFRTGDLGLLDENGCLWVLGRVDAQFKIRGNRVETAEVEVAMRELPDVQEAAVIHQGETDEERMLVGFVAATGNPEGNELRKLLADSLPDYMIPSVIVVLDELPRNANGKVDRPALRALQVTPTHDIGSSAEVSKMALTLPSVSMPDLSKPFAQPVVIGKQYFHPSGEFIPITPEELNQSVLHRWESIVARFGENRALEEGERALTYTELNAQMNLVAHAILARQVAKELPIAVIFDIEGDLAVAIFGIWKAGSFFVLLEPDQPSARKQTIIEDSGATLVVTNRQYAQIARDLYPGRDCVIVIEDLIDAASSKQATINPPITLTGDSTAYIIYTSGSTGKPKGTVDSHRNLLMMLLVRQALLHFSTQDRINLLVLGSGWSFATLGALLYGASLLPYRAKEEGLARFSQWLIDRRVTITIGGSILRTWLLTLDGRQTFPDIRAVSVGASPSYVEHFHAFQRYLPDTAIFLNTYSATEVRSCTLFVMDKETPLKSRFIPAGYPSMHGSVEIWDDEDRPLPVGETGEVIAITPYAAKGYWNAPELTASRFGVDGRGRRFYRMGDLGRLDEDGCLWVLGRKDSQVKIRGNRVETAEVEMALRELPNVQESAVIAIGDSDETRVLIAYVASSADLAGNDLRQQLALRLPEFMVPSTIVVLEELPNNRNGKVARSMLRDMAIAFTKANSATPSAPADAIHSTTTDAKASVVQVESTPQSETERRVAATVTKLFNGITIGRHDNFFDVGGHSLLAVRLMLTIGRTFGVDLTPRDFLADPTIAGLAAHIDRTLHEQSRHALLDASLYEMGVELIPLVDGLPTRLPLFTFPGWNGARDNSLRSEIIIRQLHNQWPIYSFAADGQDENNRIFATLDELVGAVMRLVRRVQPHGPYALMGSCSGGKLAYALAQALTREGEEIATLILLDVPAIPRAMRPSVKQTKKGILRHRIEMWRLRFAYHRKEMAKQGFEGGTRYLVEHLAALLPSFVQPNSRVRQKLVAHKLYPKLLGQFLPLEPYYQPVTALFTPLYKIHQEHWQKIMPQMDVTIVDGSHLDYARTHTEEVGRMMRKAMDATLSK